MIVGGYSRRGWICLPVALNTPLLLLLLLLLLDGVELGQRDSRRVPLRHRRETEPNVPNPTVKRSFNNLQRKRGECDVLRWLWLMIAAIQTPNRAVMCLLRRAGPRPDASINSNATRQRQQDPSRVPSGAEVVAPTSDRVVACNNFSPSVTTTTTSTTKRHRRRRRRRRSSTRSMQRNASGDGCALRTQAGTEKALGKHGQVFGAKCGSFTIPSPWRLAHGVVVVVGVGVGARRGR
uniref:Uncharacterized protein n=1 Tax=Anopheles farauti TaxID=69004 RepID=A0A182PZY1_9DIPT